MGTFHKVAEAKGLAPGKGMATEVAGNRIALFNVDGTCYASVDAYCVVFREKLSSASKNPGLEGHRKIRRPRAPQLPPPPRFHY